jgi:GTPase SAR1 family protein
MTELKTIRESNVSDEESDLRFKIILLGASRVGKSNILSRIVHNKFHLGTPPTIGIEYGNLKVLHENRFYQLEVWDIESARELSELPDFFYFNAIGRYFGFSSAFLTFPLISGAFVVFDLTKKESLVEAKKLILQLQEKANSLIYPILLGNKSDLANLREISPTEVRDLKLVHCINSIEVSAFTGEGLKDAVTLITGEIVKLITKVNGYVPLQLDKLKYKYEP